MKLLLTQLYTIELGTLQTSATVAVATVVYGYANPKQRV